MRAPQPSRMDKWEATKEEVVVHQLTFRRQGACPIVSEGAEPSSPGRKDALAGRLSVVSRSGAGPRGDRGWTRTVPTRSGWRVQAAEEDDLLRGIRGALIENRCLERGPPRPGFAFSRMPNRPTALVCSTIGAA